MTRELADRAPRSYAFGPFVLMPERQLLTKNDAPVRIGNRALDILTALVERPGEPVSKRELMARVWPNVIVEESNLKVNMAALRRALGDGAGAAQYIATVTGRGYRFIAPVQVSGLSGVAPPSWAAITRSHNLPIATTRIFGRADVIEAIERDLDEYRLVSIVGAGGIGKTTVALAVAEHAIELFRDGVWLVDLALLKDPALAPNAIATAVGLAAHSANMLAALCEFLRDREMLLVLDSCEHIIDAAASCADRILANTRDVKILATSREPLLVKGERLRRLPGLDTPPSSSRPNAEEALTFPAIQLFAERATERLEAFKLMDADAPTVAEICRRLDGLALAIELAATRVDVFGVGGVLKQLDDRFRLLAGRRAGPERHRTLTAALDWSYSLLSADEAALLRAVSVCAGAFDLDGASAVSGVDTPAAAEALAQLAAKSLLATDLDGDGFAYRLLETTRTYCLERLRVSAEDQAVRRRHAEHVHTVLERAAREWAQRPAGEWGAAYGRVLDDLRGALAWAGRDPAYRPLLIRLTVAGSLLWNHFSLTEECRVHVSRAVEELDAAGLAGTAVEMKLQVSLAGATIFVRGLMPEVLVALRRALGIAIQIGDTDYRLRCLRMIGVYELFTGDHDAGIRTLETFASVAAAEDPSALPEGETHLGIAELFVGRLEKARRRLERLYEHDLQDFNNSRFVRFLYARNVDVGNVLSNVQWLTGSPDTAVRTVEATVEQALKTKHELSLSNALAVAACPVFFLSGRYEECGRYVDMLGDLVARHGIVTWRPVALFYRAALAGAQRDVPAKVVDDLKRSVEEFRAINHLARMPYYLSAVADALAKRGSLGDAETTIQAALDIARAQNEGWCLPEVLRIQASILAAQGRSDEAESLLVESMAFAQETGAFSWRLRSANDLAELWRVRSREDDAHKMLLSVYKEFSEGFATRDLMVAADLLASLARPGGDARQLCGTGSP
ncbi:ATP-binding protein [Taklimakanibacter deserti]|uniref:ATP-binding protein n=1 Tax=Taklimakanibacter deserti TaxID=2267839 RepID=UPI000E64E62D